MNKLLSTLFKLAIRLLKLMAKMALLFLSREVLVRKREEEKMKDMVRREAQSRMNEFLGVISHDLKTPLTSIKGNVQLMGRRLRNNPAEEITSVDETRKLLVEARDLLERTDQQVNRLTRLVNGLLEGARIYANTMDLLFELTELNVLVSEIVKDVRYVPSERTVHLKIANEKSVLVMADVTRIKQVMIQYLSNAHKYSARDQPIEVTLLQEGQLARVQVRDKGQGIPPGEHKKIWERFYRVPGIPVLNGSEVGLGLGLHICRCIVEQHSGKVGVHSSPGEGSTFWFTLPLAEKRLKAV